MYSNYFVLSKYADKIVKRHTRHFFNNEEKHSKIDWHILSQGYINEQHKDCTKKALTIT